MIKLNLLSENGEKVISVDVPDAIVTAMIGSRSITVDNTTYGLSPGDCVPKIEKSSFTPYEFSITAEVFIRSTQL